MWCQGIEAERHHCTGSFFRKMRSSYWIDNTDNDSQPMVINHQPKLPLDYKKRPRPLTAAKTGILVSDINSYMPRRYVMD